MDETMNEMEEFDNIIALTDEEGNEVNFEFIDSIEYEGGEYAVFLPTDENEENEVVILKVEEVEDSDEVSFVSIDDENTLNAVFEIFKTKFEEEYSFEDDAE